MGNARKAARLAVFLTIAVFAAWPVASQEGKAKDPSPPGCAGSCEATFPQLAGQSNVPVRLENLVISSGRVQGTLSFGFPGQPFTVGLAASP